MYAPPGTARAFGSHGPTRRTLRRALVAAMSLATLATLPVATTGSAALAAPAASASCATALPAGAKTPTGCSSLATNARTFVTANAPAGAVPTHEWWSSLLWKRNDCAYSDNLMAHPMSFHPSGNGLGVSYPTTPVIVGSKSSTAEYHFPYSTDFVLGVAGLAAPRTLVDGWSDWTVTAAWSDGARSLKSTLGHGLPFVYNRV